SVRIHGQAPRVSRRAPERIDHGAGHTGSSNVAIAQEECACGWMIRVMRVDSPTPNARPPAVELTHEHIEPLRKTDDSRLACWADGDLSAAPGGTGGPSVNAEAMVEVIFRAEQLGLVIVIDIDVHGDETLWNAPVGVGAVPRQIVRRKI